MTDELHPFERSVRRLASLHDQLAGSHPKLARGQIWCRKCRRTMGVNSAEALRSGWPECCRHTMTIDPPEEWDDA